MSQQSFGSPPQRGYSDGPHSHSYGEHEGYDTSAMATSMDPYMSYDEEYDQDYYVFYNPEDEEYTYQSEILESPHMRMALVMGAVFCVMALSIIWIVTRSGRPEAFTNLVNDSSIAFSQPDSAAEPISPVVSVPTTTTISPFFAPSVKYWEPQILIWAEAHNLDPNLVATIMQIESCGDPQAVSIAGAQGLFQVMPFHFTAGENMTEPETNARRGVGYLAEMMGRFNNNPGLAMAGYNGGPGNAVKSQDQWPAETQRYFRWGTGIYTDAQAGLATSATLDRWMEAGGASLCRQAAARVGIQP